MRLGAGGMGLNEFGLDPVFVPIGVGWAGLGLGFVDQ